MIKSKITDMEERSFTLKLEIKQREMSLQLLKNLIHEHVQAE